MQLHWASWKKVLNLLSLPYKSVLKNRIRLRKAKCPLLLTAWTNGVGIRWGRNMNKSYSSQMDGWRVMQYHP